MPPIYAPIAERFLSAVHKDDHTGCWLWMRARGMTSTTGYGSIYWRGRNERAHRVSYMLFIGDIPEGMFVCHACDNPQCVNPDHLFVGTAKDNARDASLKGRVQPLGPSSAPCNQGAKNGQAKLTPEQVTAIRNERAAGAKLLDLARKYGVSLTQIHNIVHRKKWATV